MSNNISGKKRLKSLLFGASGAALFRGLRFGACDFFQSCERTLYSVHPRENGHLARIPKVSLSEVVGNASFVIRYLRYTAVDGAMPPDQAFLLISVLLAENPREVLEIGTFMGHTTRLIAENLEGAVVHTVDLPLNFSGTTGADASKDDIHLIQGRNVGREFRDTPQAAHIVQHFADTMTWDFADVGHPTCFFIDGSHTYEAVRHDSEACYELCGGKGVFLWHDCDDEHPGVVRALSEWRNLGRNIVRIENSPLAYWKGI